MRWLILLFLILPALEIGVFIWIGGMIGPGWVVFLIILTGLLGITIAKREGLGTLYRIRQSIQLGQAPTGYLIDGIAIFIGGVFLFAPGFITDIIGFALVIPLTRSWFKVLIIMMIKRMINNRNIYIGRW